MFLLFIFLAKIFWESHISSSLSILVDLLVKLSCHRLGIVGGFLLLVCFTLLLIQPPVEDLFWISDSFLFSQPFGGFKFCLSFESVSIHCFFLGVCPFNLRRQPFGIQLFWLVISMYFCKIRSNGLYFTTVLVVCIFSGFPCYSSCLLFVFCDLLYFI